MTLDKLLKLREWLTVGEAAGELSRILGGNVSAADVLRLALEGHLKLSVNLPAGADAMCFENDGEQRPKQRRHIDGLWELPMIGAARRQVDHEFHSLRGLPLVSMEGSAGAIVERGGVSCQLPADQGELGFSSRPASALPQGSVIVVRRAALDEFAAQMSAVPPPDESSPSEEVNWRDRWRDQDAWTVREFAQLCCGLNPGGMDNFPDHHMALYNEARDSINRAVRVKVLRTIDELAWPATGAEHMYEAVPAFKPCEVAPWAAKRYPGVFPYSADAWEKDLFARAGVLTTTGEGNSAESEGIVLDNPTKPSADGLDKRLGERERATLLTIIAALAEKAGIDVSKPSRAALAIEALTIEKGARVAARTVEEHLKHIPDALERKGKTSA